MRAQTEKNDGDQGKAMKAAHCGHKRIISSLRIAFRSLFFLFALLACEGEGERHSRPLAMRVSLPGDILELDPRFAGDATSLRLSRLIFSGLVRVDANSLEIVPELAENWSWRSPTHLSLNLRQGLRFSDGQEFSSADVVATIEALRSGKLPRARYAHLFDKIDNISAPSKFRVEVILKTADVTALSDLEMPIVRARDARKHLKEQAVGIGPYRVEHWSDSRHITLVRNELWFRKSARPKRVEFVVVRDANTRLMRLLSAKDDVVAAPLSPVLLRKLAETPKIGLSSAAGVSTTYIGLNHLRPALAELEVREALLEAIDREALVRTLRGGRARVAHGFFPPGHPSFVSRPLRSYDVASATKRLRGAELARLRFRVFAEPQYVAAAKAIASMWRDAGVRVSVRPSPKGVLLWDLARGDFDVALMKLPEVVEAHTLSYFFLSSRFPEDGGGNRWRFRSVELDRLFSEGLSIVSPAERARHYRQVDAFFARNLPALPLWHDASVLVYARRAGNLKADRLSRFDFLLSGRSESR